jgi:cell division protein FtsI/penicillin-binding protein 2
MYGGPSGLTRTAAVEEYNKQKERKHMSIFEDMKQIAMDTAEIIDLSGTTKATQGKQLTLTDVPTFIRNRCTDEEQHKILKLMQHRKDERERKLEIRAESDKDGTNS